VWEYGGRNGKAAKSRCFKNLKINNLPVMWRNNKKAWMTAATVEEWLTMLNAIMKKENRNVILLLGSATCHPKVTLSNVKID
jgi:3-deoxy-D-arabino-heptulosonate 7-phosphate (DAHP) synthase